MNFLDKNRLTFWILIFLVVINVTAFTTFLIVNRKVDNSALPAPDVKPGAILQSELSLSPDQNTKVSEINTAFKAGSEPIILSIKEKKAELLEELSKENTDTNQINSILNDLGIRQNQLQHANIKQFLELKKVCTPEQTKKLSQIYSELYGCDVGEKGKGQGKGQGQGMKHRHRYGQQGNNK
jgi:Spy/CpxP family protein refolding chaperone